MKVTVEDIQLTLQRMNEAHIRLRAKEDLSDREQKLLELCSFGENRIAYFYEGFPEQYEREGDQDHIQSYARYTLDLESCFSKSS